jgi:hypothetical protein
MSFAQTDFFKSMSTPSLNPEQSIRYQKILNAPHLKNHRLIRLENLATTQFQGKLAIRLAGLACENLLFQARNVEYASENDYYWYGDIREEEEGLCQTGTIMLIAKNGEKYGQIRLGDRTFEWQDLNGNIQVISEHKNEFFANVDCGVNEHNTLTGTDPIIPAEDYERSGCPPTTTPIAEPIGTVRVLVLFTPAAVAVEPNIQARANLAIQQSNQIFANSKISSRNARLVLAGVEILNFMESGNISNDRFLLRDNVIAQARRNATSADLVVLMTNGNYIDASGIVAAIGPDNANAYAIVETLFSTSNQRVFTHELGHLFGARHDEFDPDATYERGRVFRTGLFSLFRNNWTVMAILPPADRGRIDYFSNPNVRYKSVRTGTDDRNNARRLNETGNTVADFRPAPTISIPATPFSVSVSAPETYPACSRGACATATITCGIPPYTIRWDYSLDGITWQPTNNTTTGYCFVTPCNPGGQFWVRVTVTDSQGNVRVAGKVIELTGSGSGNGWLRSTEENIITNIYPNPLNEQSQIKINLPEAENIRIELSNMYGTLRREIINQYFSAGEHIITIPRNKLPQGLYAIKLSLSSGYTEIKNIVINP